MNLVAKSIPGVIQAHKPLLKILMIFSKFALKVIFTLLLLQFTHGLKAFFRFSFQFRFLTIFYLKIALSILISIPVPVSYTQTYYLQI